MLKLNTRLGEVATKWYWILNIIESIRVISLLNWRKFFHLNRNLTIKQTTSIMFSTYECHIFIAYRHLETDFVVQ